MHCFHLVHQQQDREVFLQALLPNEFEDAQLVVEMLTTLVVAGFEWLVVLSKLQPGVELIHTALLTTGNALLAAQSPHATQICTQLGVGNVWAHLLQLKQAVSQLTTLLAITKQNVSRAELVISSKRDVERKRLLQLRETEAEGRCWERWRKSCSFWGKY